MTSLDSLVCLQERTALGILSPTVLEAISAVIKEQIIPANTRLIEEDTNPVALYILIQGQLESNRINQLAPTAPYGFLPGAVINLQELLLEQQAAQTVTTLSECHLWTIPAATFRQLVAQYPEIA